MHTVHDSYLLYIPFNVYVEGMHDTYILLAEYIHVVVVLSVAYCTYLRKTTLVVLLSLF